MCSSVNIMQVRNSTMGHFRSRSLHTR
jgi:hypothetical protein